MPAHFQIPSTPQSTKKSIRFPEELAAAVEEKIEGEPCTFSAFVIAAVQHALEQLKEQDS